MERKVPIGLSPMAVHCEIENLLLSSLQRIGSGKTSARHLSYDEARDAMTAVLNQQYDPVTFGAFFMAQRFKGESAEEVAGFLDAMHDLRVEPSPGNFEEIKHLVDCAGAYDGKTRTLNFGLAASIIAASAGASVVLHSARRIPTKLGTTVLHIMQKLGLRPAYILDQGIAQLREAGITCLEQHTFHPRLWDLARHRRCVGKRTILNSVETLANPIGAAHHVGGYFHDSYGTLLCDAVLRSRSRFQRMVMVRGTEGSDELRPGLNSLLVLDQGVVRTEEVNPSVFGWNLTPPDAVCTDRTPEGVARESADVLAGVLEGEHDTPQAQLCLLNAGIRVYASGLTANVYEGIDAARDAARRGAGRKIFEQWRSTSKTPTLTCSLSPEANS